MVVKMGVGWINILRRTGVLLYSLCGEDPMQIQAINLSVCYFRLPIYLNQKLYEKSAYQESTNILWGTQHQVPLDELIIFLCRFLGQDPPQKKKVMSSLSSKLFPKSLVLNLVWEQHIEVIVLVSKSFSCEHHFAIFTFISKSLFVDLFRI